MPITIGTQLGSHEITTLHGKGGVGEVYCAGDTKLKREVGIKILAEDFSRDTDRVSCFRREVEVPASLNHANIAGVYDLQEANGYRYLVLELVEDKTLAGRDGNVKVLDFVVAKASERFPLQILSNFPTLLSTVAGKFHVRSAGGAMFSGPRRLLFTRNNSLMAKK
jgi:serine/threonine protein kinase